MFEIAQRHFMNGSIGGSPRIASNIYDEIDRSGMYLTLTDYNRTMMLFISEGYSHNYFRQTYELILRTHTLDYELFATWLKDNIKIGDLSYSVTIYDLDVLKKHADMYKLDFHDLIDRMYPDDERKMSEALVHLSKHRNEYESFVSLDNVHYLIFAICGFRYVIVYEDDLDEFFP